MLAWATQHSASARPGLLALRAIHASGEPSTKAASKSTASRCGNAAISAQQGLERTSRATAASASHSASSGTHCSGVIATSSTSNAPRSAFALSRSRQPSSIRAAPAISQPVRTFMSFARCPASALAPGTATKRSAASLSLIMPESSSLTMRADHRATQPSSIHACRCRRKLSPRAVKYWAP